MKTNVTKWFFDFEKEEEWLNNMAAKGWNLAASHAPKYTFEEGPPGEYIYRLTLLEHGSSHPETISYIRFMEETGAEHVSTLSNGWIYFRKKAADNGDFEIFTDTDSRIRHYKRMARVMGWASIGCLLLMTTQIPFALWAFIERGSVWGLANVMSGVFCAFMAYLAYRPWARFTAKAKQLKQEQEVFE